MRTIARPTPTQLITLWEITSDQRGHYHRERKREHDACKLRDPYVALGWHFENELFLF